MLLRAGAGGLEILFLRRNPALAFQGDHWVFPGGRIDLGDEAADLPADALAAARRAAVREAREEAGIAVPLASLVYAIHWTTPTVSPIRFATSFFVARAPTDEVTIDDGEIHAFEWLQPADALARHRKRAFKLAAPTYALTTRIGAFDDVDRALAAVATWPEERLLGKIRAIDDGRVALYHPDAAYGGGALAEPGPRHRLWMARSGWRYERTF